MGHPCNSGSVILSVAGSSSTARGYYEQEIGASHVARGQPRKVCGYNGFRAQIERPHSLALCLERESGGWGNEPETSTDSILHFCLYVIHSVKRMHSCPQILGGHVPPVPQWFRRLYMQLVSLTSLLEVCIARLRSQRDRQTKIL